MSLTPESRDTPRRHEWFTLRPFAVIAASVACVWSTSLIVKGWQASHAPLTSRPSPRAEPQSGIWLPTRSHGTRR